MAILIAAGLFGALFGSVEIIARRYRINTESSRKFVHIIAGVAAAFLPFGLTFPQIVVLALIFIPIMLISRNANLFSAIHKVSRRTYGELFFPLAIALTALLFPHRLPYMFGILVMALSDGFASVIGLKYGRRLYIIWHSRKSYVGSSMFLIISALLGITILIVNGLAFAHAIFAGLVLAGVLTVIEAALPYGLDNLVLPLLGALLFQLII